MKPKTQRLKKKKPQEQALKQARLKQKTKPQPAPEKPKVIQTTTPAMKSRIKMVESQQKPKPLAGAMRTAGQPMVVAGRMTRQQMLERKKKRMMSGRMKKNKPLRRS